MPRWKDRLTDPAPEAPSLNASNNAGMIQWAKACAGEDQRKATALATGAPLVARRAGEIWVVTLTDPNTGEVFSGCFSTPAPDRGAF